MELSVAAALLREVDSADILREVDSAALLRGVEAAVLLRGVNPRCFLRGVDSAAILREVVTPALLRSDWVHPGVSALASIPHSGRDVDRSARHQRSLCLSRIFLLEFVGTEVTTSTRCAGRQRRGAPRA